MNVESQILDACLRIVKKFVSKTVEIARILLLWGNKSCLGI